MKTMTVAEASEKWNITPRRVYKLASEGRIPRAKYVNRHWLIPSDAVKPSDGRRKANRNLKEEQYIFPNVLLTLCTEHPVDELNGEEKRLYDVYMQYESGNFEEAVKTGNDLLDSTSNPYIRIGTWYVLFYSYIFLRKFREADIASSDFFRACINLKKHREEVSLLAHELEAYIGSTEWFFSDFCASSSLKNSSDFEIAYLSFLFVMKAYWSIALGQMQPPIASFELLLVHLEKEGYRYFSMLCHFFIFAMYVNIENSDLAHHHLRQALDLAIENRTYAYLSGFMCYVSAAVVPVLEEYPEEVKNKFLSLMELGQSTFSAYLSHRGTTSLWSDLTLEELSLITYSLGGSTIKQIAESKASSSSAVQRQLLRLYRKVGVKGKEELVSAYSSAIARPITK